MSKRKRKQQGLLLLVIALIAALIAGSAGFATGYGADAAKRNALKKEVAELKALTDGKNEEANSELLKLKEENASLSESVADLEEEINALKKENASLSEKANSANTNTGDGALLDPVTRQNESEASDDGNVTGTNRVSMVDKITKYVIIAIVAILVLMGISMMFISRREDDYEDYDDDNDDYEEKNGTDMGGMAEEKVVNTAVYEKDNTAASYDEKEEDSTFEEFSFKDDVSEQTEKYESDIDYERYVPIEEEKAPSENGAKVPETLEELMNLSGSGDARGE